MGLNMSKPDSIAYVNALQLAVPKAKPLPKQKLHLLKTVEGDAYVNEGSLVSFVGGVSPQTKADVLNSILLAQLAANYVADRENDTLTWYKKYREVLENIGWAISQFDFTKARLSGATVQIKTVVLALLAAIMSENPLAIARATLAAIQALGEGDQRVALFSASSSTANAGNFQIGTVIEAQNTPTMMMGAFSFSSVNVSVSFLWQSFKVSDMSLYEGGQTITLSESVYSRVRQAIIDKLGDRAEEYVANIPI
jgi:hypothetical protein